MTLIVGPPGSGKSALLKALSTSFPSGLTTSLLYCLTTTLLYLTVTALLHLTATATLLLSHDWPLGTLLKAVKTLSFVRLT